MKLLEYYISWDNHNIRRNHHSGEENKEYCVSAFKVYFGKSVCRICYKHYFKQKSNARYDDCVQIPQREIVIFGVE